MVQGWLCLVFMWIHLGSHRTTCSLWNTKEKISSSIIELSDDNFETKVTKPAKPFLVEFYAPWCGHCKRIQPLYEDLAHHHKDSVLFGKLNCVQHTRTQRRYMIQSFPTFFLFHDGTIAEYRGSRSFSQFTSFLKRHNVLQKMVPERNEIHTFRGYSHRGFGETVQLALEELAIEYETENFDSDEDWIDFLEANDLSLPPAPTSQLPNLSIGRHILVGAGTILRHLGRIYDLYGDTTADTYRIDQGIDYLETVRDHYESLVKGERCFFSKDETEKNEQPYFSPIEVEDWDKCLISYQTNVESDFLQWMENNLQNTKISFLGKTNSLTILDLMAFDLVSLHLGVGGPSRLSCCAYVSDWFQGLASRDNLHAYLNSDRRLEYAHPSTYLIGNHEHRLNPANNPIRLLESHISSPKTTRKLKLKPAQIN